MKTEHYPKVYLYRRIVHAKLFIDAHFSENLDIDNISDEAFFSKFHFIRLFKKAYDKTPHQYLTFVRIEKAKQLLQTNRSVSEVCFSVGFESVSSFSGLFKRMAGMSPSTFLEKQLHLKIQISQAPLKFLPGCFASQHGWIKNSNFGEVI